MGSRGALDEGGRRAQHVDPVPSSLRDVADVRRVRRLISVRALPTPLLLLWLAGCNAPPAPGPAPSASAPAASAEIPLPPAPLPTTALSDRELGRLSRDVSESSGDFPSDNLVSNETSYLHPIDALPRGGAYVGVGPEQSFAYLAVVEPEIAWIIDIRRDNRTLHLVYKTAFERAPTRLAFVATLLSRKVGDGGLPESATVAEVLGAAGSLPKDDPKVLREAVVERAAALGLELDAHDLAHVDAIVRGFATEGLKQRYSMKGSSRTYPTLGELLAAGDLEGRARGFLASEASYQRVRRLQAENRVIPVVGDLAGSGAMPRIAAELSRRKLPVSLLYTSNVEQYLMESPKTWAAWVRNVGALPWAADGKILRVYFDQGRKHPSQAKGHRTVSLLFDAAGFVERGARAKSYWAVVTP